MFKRPVSWLTVICLVLIVAMASSTLTLLLAGAAPADTADGDDPLARAREIGAAAYLGELGEKMDIFQYLLHTCNDGRRKSLFALAANLLPLEDLRRVRSDLTALDAPLSLRAREAARLLDEAARARGIALRLRKKPPRR